ncbi:MAG: dipeptide epimerase [Candidatus Promineifilaceae bacterium]|jgi:L-alanine-DL-glutamate epimerase-like enolase superfamily enzyme
MSKRLTWQELTLKLHNPFRVSYGASVTRQAHWIRLEEDQGWGEGTIPPYYGVNPEDMTAVWQRAARSSEPFPNDPAEISAWVGNEGPAPARTALDLALHDRIGKLLDKPLYELLGLPAPEPMVTSFTVSIDTPQAMAKAAAAVPEFPVIKIKLGSDDDVACLAAVRRARPDAKLRIDANAAWTAEEAIARLQHMLPFNLEMVEQPVARDDFAGMAAVQAVCDVPVVADESVQTLEDVEKLAAGGVQGINLKLMKIGGLAPTLELLRRGQALGLRIMLGCMMETSIGVTAMAHLAGAADWLDLDAPLLIVNDPFDGVIIDQRARLKLPQRPGIGVIKRMNED